MVDTHLMVRLNNLPGCLGIKSLMRCFIMTFWHVLQTAVLSCYKPPKCQLLLNPCVLVSLVSVRLLGLAEDALRVHQTGIPTFSQSQQTKHIKNSPIVDQS